MHAPAPIEVFEVKADGSNVEELLAWSEGTVTRMGVQCGGRDGSTLSGPLVYARITDGTTVEGLTGVKREHPEPPMNESIWASFVERKDGLPMWVLVKGLPEYPDRIVARRVHDLLRSGYMSPESWRSQYAER